MSQLLCPNGHPVSRNDNCPEGYYYCGDCPARDGAGGILSYGICYHPDRIKGAS